MFHSAGFETTTPNDARVAKNAVANATIAPVLTPATGGTVKVKAEASATAKTYIYFLVIDGVLDVSILNGQISFPGGTTPL